MGSQTTSWNESLPDLSDIYNEKFFLQTDRYIYAVGERILFKAFNISHPDIQRENWSKVLYMELIKPDGTTAKKAKFPLTRDGSHGYLEIPENILTGNYYLVVYSKWMRNFTPGDYTFNMIKIINPYKSQLEESSVLRDKNSDSTEVTDGSSITAQTKPVLKKNVILCQTNKKTYYQREEVIVNITIPDGVYLTSTGCCLFVVRPGVTDALDYSFLSPDSVMFERGQYLSYIPEMRGLSVTGKVVSGQNKGPLRNAHVQLLTMGDNPDFLAYNTRENGEFFFVLNPLTGNHDMFITAEHHTEQSLDILIDNDFSVSRVKFNSQPFTLSGPEKEKAGEIMFNMQIGKLYNETNTGKVQPVKQVVPSGNFYGKPSNVVYIDDYIELPTLEEVFIELVPEVYPVIRKNKTQLIIRNDYYSHQSLSIDPLILVDRIPISDQEKVLLLTPSRIQRIEVVNELFLLGDIFYGGIISIFTKSRNLAGIDMPENSFFFNFQHFEDQDIIEFPKYTEPENTTNLPDYRNCIYWDPDIHIQPFQTTQVQFYTSDTQGEFIIYVHGVNREGEIVEGTCTFRVE